MKYGVVSVKTLIDDLLNWRSLYVSGRMHKPVRILKFPSSSNSSSTGTAAAQLLGGGQSSPSPLDAGDAIKEASNENLRHALRAALLLLPATFSERTLYLVSD